MIPGWLAGALLLATVAPAAAQQQFYYFVERGHWWVGTAGPGECRAGNRPVQELNAAPFNSLQFVVEAGNRVGVDLYLWPGAVDPATPQDIHLFFKAKVPFVLPAKSHGDFMLSSGPVAKSPILRALADASRVRVRLAGRDDIDLLFMLDDGAWLLQNLLTCSSHLPKS